MVSAKTPKESGEKGHVPFSKGKSCKNRDFDFVFICSSYRLN